MTHADDLGPRDAGIPETGVPRHAMLICDVKLLELRPTRPIPYNLKDAEERKRQRK